ncbi:MAG: hypothetical protein LBB76_05660 [Azoarcus sp.]|nr:hypothetical protein [Azoarcus sp.]
MPGTLRFHDSIDTLPPNLRDAVADAGAVGELGERFEVPGGGGTTCGG